jgi:hypothetical protein
MKPEPFAAHPPSVSDGQRAGFRSGSDSGMLAADVLPSAQSRHAHCHLERQFH